MRNIRWFLLLGSALIFGDAIVLIYGIGGQWFGGPTAHHVVNIILIASLWLFPYFITKKVLSNSVACKSEAKALGIFLMIMGHIANTVGYAVAYALGSPPAEWIKKFSAMTSWDEFFLGLVLPTKYFVLALVGFAVFIAYKNTVPIKETPTQSLAKPTDKKISLWTTILLISAILLVVPGYGLSLIILGDSGDPWGLGMLILVPFLVLVCVVTLIVQYGMKSPKAALVIAILMNVLLISMYGWDIVEPMLDKGPFILQEETGKIINSTQEEYKGIRTGIYFDKYKKNEEGKFVHDESGEWGNGWTAYPLKFVNDELAQLAKDYMNKNAFVLVVYEKHKQFGVSPRHSTYWLVKKIKQQAGEEFVGIKELTGRFANCWSVGVRDPIECGKVDFVDDVGNIYEVQNFYEMKDSELKQKIIQYARAGTHVRIQTGFPIIIGENGEKGTIWNFNKQNLIKGMWKLPSPSDVDTNNNVEAVVGTDRY